MFHWLPYFNYFLAFKMIYYIWWFTYYAYYIISILLCCVVFCVCDQKFGFFVFVIRSYYDWPPRICVPSWSCPHVATLCPPVVCNPFIFYHLLILNYLLLQFWLILLVGCCWFIYIFQSLHYSFQNIMGSGFSMA